MKRVIAKGIAAEVDLGEDEVFDMIETPSQEDHGDFAFPCFILAKKMHKSPVEIAKELSKSLNKGKSKQIYSVEPNGPYVNFFSDRRLFAKQVLERFEKKNPFALAKKGKTKTLAIEFSQPNTHKAFHVGHIKGTSTGESLARITEFSGDKAIRLNYSGDIGMHIAKWIWCYQKISL